MYDPRQQWEASTAGEPRAGERSLRVPIGQKLGGEVQYLDFVKDGPHGILIGQSGSGKSELLRTLVTALAVAYPPWATSFLLIDYKAGVAIEPFRHLPHTINLLSDVSSPEQIFRFVTML